MTKVLLVSGSWPPQVCGVGDYTHVLGHELEKAGVTVQRFASERFSQLYAPSILDEIERTDCDAIHIQYPTAGYGRSLTPSAIARAVRDRPVVVTLHEYSVFKPYRRAWFSPFARYCAARIFTTGEERALFEQRFPKRRGIDTTIEIGSNVPVAPGRQRQPNQVCYFGLIAPSKGLETFLELARLAGMAGSSLSFEMIGAVPDRHRRYADDMIARARTLGVDVSLQLADHAVAERLAAATFAYLPFPDGASAKRGTLAAAFVNGLIVATQHSALTPDWIRGATLACASPQEALSALTRLQANATARADLGRRVANAARHFRWDAIADRHAALYQSLLQRPALTGFANRRAAGTSDHSASASH
ncbi:MAG: glycosyltransferase family 4 protein [Proteobacteria bacterium]|nr:glycosyltransferase family 4 protein [Pseudomonadota bacterium]